MNNIIWKVQMEKDIYPWKGQAVLCVWKEKNCMYEVFHRGSLCGFVQEPFAGGITIPENFLIARIIKREGMEMEIMLKGKDAQTAIALPATAIPFANCRKAS